MIFCGSGTGGSRRTSESGIGLTRTSRAASTPPPRSSAPRPPSPTSLTPSAVRIPARGPRPASYDTNRIAPQAIAMMACMQRAAVIDMGSNSFRLVVYGYEPARYWHLVDEIREAVRVGEGVGD